MRCLLLVIVAVYGCSHSKVKLSESEMIYADTHRYTGAMSELFLMDLSMDGCTLDAVTDKKRRILYDAILCAAFKRADECRGKGKNIDERLYQSALVTFHEHQIVAPQENLCAALPNAYLCRDRKK